MVGLIEREVDENLKVSFDEIHKTLFFERKESEEPKRYKISVASYGDFKRDIKNLLDKKDIKDIIEKSLKSGLGKKDDKEIDKFNGVFSEFLFWFYLYLEDNKNILGEYSGLVNSCLGLFNSISPEIAWRVYFKDMSVGNKIEILKKNLEILKKNLEKRYLYWWTYKTLADICIEELEKITHPVFKLKLRAQSYKQNKDELIENVNEYIRMIISEPRKSEMEKYFSWFGKSSEDEVERVITKMGKMVRDFYNQVDLIAKVRDWFLSRYNLESVSIVEGRTFKKSKWIWCFIILFLLLLTYIILNFISYLSCFYFLLLMFLVIIGHKIIVNGYKGKFLKEFNLIFSKKIIIGCLLGYFAIWFEIIKGGAGFLDFVCTIIEDSNKLLVYSLIIFSVLILLIIMFEMPSYLSKKGKILERTFQALEISLSNSFIVNLLIWPITFFSTAKVLKNENSIFTNSQSNLFFFLVVSTILFGVIVKQLSEKTSLFKQAKEDK